MATKKLAQDEIFVKNIQEIKNALDELIGTGLISNNPTIFLHDVDFAMLKRCYGDRVRFDALFEPHSRRAIGTARLDKFDGLDMFQARK